MRDKKNWRIKLYIFVLCNKLLSTNSGGKTRYYAKFYKKKRKLKITQQQLKTKNKQRQIKKERKYRMKNWRTSHAISKESRTSTYTYWWGKGGFLAEWIWFSPLLFWSSILQVKYSHSKSNRLRCTMKIAMLTFYIKTIRSWLQ